MFVALVVGTGVGDIASIDADGAMTIRDRSKDVIKSGGEWISSVDLENYIMGLPEVERAAVVAQPHPKWDERPVCVCILTADCGDAVAKTITQTVRDFCAKKFAKYELPDEVRFTELPPQLAWFTKPHNKQTRLTSTRRLVPSLWADVAWQVLVWDELPLTGTGKMDKKTIRAKLKAEKYVLPDLRAPSSSRL